MKAVTVMSGPAIRKLKADNSRLREQNRRLRRVFDAAKYVRDQLAKAPTATRVGDQMVSNYDVLRAFAELDGPIAAAAEILD